MKNGIRKDSATAQFDVIRIFFSMAAVLHFRLGFLDIQGDIYRAVQYSVKYSFVLRKIVVLSGGCCGNW